MSIDLDAQTYLMNTSSIALFLCDLNLDRVIDLNAIHALIFFCLVFIIVCSVFIIIVFRCIYHLFIFLLKAIDSEVIVT